MADRGRHAKKIDTVHWTYGSFLFGALTAGTAALNVLSAQHLPETLLRMRGEWTAWLDGTNAPPLALSITLGMILVPEGTGTTVLWSPVTDGDAPWIWWDTFSLAYEEMVTDVISIQAMTGARRIIDSKAMRKVRNRELQVVAENTTTIGGAEGVNVVGSGRFLSGS